MQYEFELFEKIIYDHSSLFALKNDDLNSYKSIFKSKCGNIYDVVVADFKRGSKGFSLKGKKKICSLHPEIEKINKGRLNLFQDDIPEILDGTMLKTLQIKSSDILTCAFNANANNNKLFIKIKSSYDKLGLEEARYYYHHLILKDETVRIKKSISDSVFRLKSQEEMEHFIHKLQQSLVNLSFKITNMYNSGKVPDIYKPAEEFNDNDILHLTYISIEDLLRFVETSFLKYIDQNIQIPYRSELVRIYDIEEKLEVVKSAFRESNLESELLNIIYKPFLQLSVITVQERITYKELIYSNTFLTAFYDHIQQSTSTLKLSAIIDLLYQFNFNAVDLVNYNISEINKQLIQYTETQDKIDYLYHCLKIANQRQCKFAIAYQTDLPSLKVQLINWLEVEINYLNKKMMLNKQQTSLFNVINEDKPKILSGLPVAQLALFFKSCFQVGIIEHENQSDIIRFISENFQTHKAKEISVESIKNKFYNTDEVSVDALKDHVIKLFNLLKDYDRIG